MSFKQLCSRVAAITGPWNCVVYRDICLLKAHSCSHCFTSNCVGYAAPKRSSGGNEPRNAAGNEPGNAAGNEPGKAAGNEPRNAAGNEPGNVAGNEPGN